MGGIGLLSIFAVVIFISIYVLNNDYFSIIICKITIGKANGVPQ